MPVSDVTDDLHYFFMIFTTKFTFSLQLFSALSAGVLEYCTTHWQTSGSCDRPVNVQNSIITVKFLHHRLGYFKLLRSLVAKLVYCCCCCHLKKSS